MIYSALLFFVPVSYFPAASFPSWLVRPLTTTMGLGGRLELFQYTQQVKWGGKNVRFDRRDLFVMVDSWFAHDGEKFGQRVAGLL